MPHRNQLQIRAIKEAMAYLKNKRVSIVAMNTKEPDFQNLAMFDRNVFYPQRKKLRDECASLGHSFGDNIDRITNDRHVECLACGIGVRRENHELSK